jgi:hypothetical protein
LISAQRKKCGKKLFKHSFQRTSFPQQVTLLSS